MESRSPVYVHLTHPPHLQPRLVHSCTDVNTHDGLIRTHSRCATNWYSSNSFELQCSSSNRMIQLVLQIRTELGSARSRNKNGCRASRLAGHSLLDMNRKSCDSKAFGGDCCTRSSASCVRVLTLSCSLARVPVSTATRRSAASRCVVACPTHVPWPKPTLPTSNTLLRNLASPHLRGDVAVQEDGF